MLTFYGENIPTDIVVTRQSAIVRTNIFKVNENLSAFSRSIFTLSCARDKETAINKKVSKFSVVLEIILLSSTFIYLCPGPSIVYWQLREHGNHNVITCP